MANWTQQRIHQLIQDNVEENLQLEYKGARSLGRQNDKTFEITKDVSAMANSIGGTLVYGVSEYTESEKSHLPEKLDPINRAQFSREWLEQIINTIQPRIEGVRIHTIEDKTRKRYGFYVIEVPQSTTAHQARDFRYYKRFNFSVVPMEDYEIRDIMNRRKNPRIILMFELERYTPQPAFGMPTFRQDPIEDAVSLEVYAFNEGSVFAQFVVATIDIPTTIADSDDIIARVGENFDEVPETVTVTVTNKKQDKGGLGNPISDVRYEPILPTLRLFLRSVNLNLDALLTSNQDLIFKWQTHADNSVPIHGTIRLGDIAIQDRRSGR